MAGNSAAMGYHLYQQRDDVDVIITDGEQVGLPLAALLRFGGRGQARHVMIGHRLSPPKKSLLIKLLGLSSGIDEVLLYSSSQRVVADTLFDDPHRRVRQIDFMVDTEFFKPTRELQIGRHGRRPLLCAAGREYRDYPTFIEAVRGLDVDVVIASASPWSKRSDNTCDVELPPNVTVTALTQRELRDLLDEADALVMPLLPSDFQAGVTTILEAMAMERPVICTATEGQTDVVEDGVNGLYVPPGDVAGHAPGNRALDRRSRCCGRHGQTGPGAGGEAGRRPPLRRPFRRRRPVPCGRQHDRRDRPRHPTDGAQGQLSSADRGPLSRFG